MTGEQVQPGTGEAGVDAGELAQKMATLDTTVIYIINIVCWTVCFQRVIYLTFLSHLNIETKKKHILSVRCVLVNVFTK